MKQNKERRENAPREFAEWVGLAISSGVILLVVGLVSYRIVADGSQPPSFSVHPDVQAIRQEGGLYYLPVTITNTGDETAEDVRGNVTLRAGQDETETAEFTIPFLPGGDSARGTAIFRRDPQQGDLTAHVVSYLIP